ncbi:hypothetical protein BS47DRAFT_1282772, partial [Hydnum rufescens UP504]
TKHIHIWFHYTRQLITKGDVLVSYCPTESMIMDILTKNLNQDHHQKFTKALGLVLHSSGS